MKLKAKPRICFWLSYVVFLSTSSTEEEERLTEKLSASGISTLESSEFGHKKGNFATRKTIVCAFCTLLAKE